MSRTHRVVWLLLLLAGCGCGSERIVFQDVLKSDCAPPCWRGVIPGITNRQDTLELLGEPPDTDTALPIAWGSSLEWGERCVNNSYFSPQAKVNLDQKDIVESIWLVDPEEQFTFQNAVDAYGPPSVVLMTPCAPDTDKGFIYLVYPDRGLALGSGYKSTFGQPWQQPSSQTHVYQWVYFDPIVTALFPSKGGPIYGCGMSYANETSPWQGFGP